MRCNAGPLLRLFLITGVEGQGLPIVEGASHPATIGRVLGERSEEVDASR